MYLSETHCLSPKNYTQKPVDTNMYPPWETKTKHFYFSFKDNIYQIYYPKYKLSVLQYYF